MSIKNLLLTAFSIILLSTGAFSQNNFTWYQIVGTKIYQIKTLESEISYEFTGVELPEKSATIAYNPKDKNLYAVTKKNNLYKITRDKKYEFVTELSFGNQYYFTSAAFDKKGNLYLNSAHANELKVLTINEAQVSESHTLPLVFSDLKDEKASYVFFDLELNPKTKMLNALDINGKLIEIDTKSGNVTEILNTNLPFGSRGSMWFTDNMEIASFHNNGNMISILNAKKNTWKYATDIMPITVNFNDGATIFKPYFNEPTTAYVSTTTVEENSKMATGINEVNDLLIFPNPTKHNFTVALNKNIAKKAIVQIIDVNGSIIFAQTLPSNSKTLFINDLDLPPGNYLVKVFSNEEVLTENLIIH